MKLEEAQKIADMVKAELAPYCERIEVAGSVRRRKPDPHDIDMVCVPRTFMLTDMLGPTGVSERDKGFWIAVNKLGTVVKGEPRAGKLIQLDIEGVNVEIFVATRDNWGLMLAIRTGPAGYSHHVLAHGWVRNGYHSIDGMMTKAGMLVPVREERDLFAIAGVEWVPPEQRT